MFGKTVSAGAMLALLISVAAFGADKTVKKDCCATKAACCQKAKPCCDHSAKKADCCAKKAACCNAAKACCAPKKAK